MASEDPSIDEPQPWSLSGDGELATTLDSAEADAEPPPDRRTRPPEIQPRIDRFALLDKLGEGGMGSVYAAFDRRLDRKVAIKLLHEGTAHDPRRRARMVREAQALARLSHPNVISVFEVGEIDEQVYVAMEFVDGPTLDQWQAQDRTWQEILAMYVAVGRGLCAAHGRNLIHRDFKPQNVLIGKDDRPRVIDFGLARLHDTKRRPTMAPPSEGGPQTSGLLRSTVTQAGSMVGTPAYMAPEQILDQKVGPASDQFSFCMALYEALYGQRAYLRRTMAAMLLSVNEPPLPLQDHRGVPQWVYEAILRGLARDPEDRWPSLEDLLQVLDQDPVTNPATGRGTRVLITVALMAMVAVTWPITAGILGAEDTVLWLLVLAVLCTIPVFGAFWVWRAAIARSTQTKTLVAMAGTYMLAIDVHRVVGWLAEFPPHALLTSDQVIFTVVAASVGRAIGAWAWIIVGLGLTGAVLSALQPAWAAASFQLTMLLSLAVAGAAFGRRR